jgi:predicted enzyme related to lactoylglutathione lyase
MIPSPPPREIPRIVAVTIDCNDLEGAAKFWSSLLHVEVTSIQDGYAFLAHSPERRVTIWLQHVPERRHGKNRVHIDLAVEDLEAAEQRIVILGGSLGARHEWHGFEWRTCYDPEGNVFDVMRAPDDQEAAGAG